MNLKYFVKEKKHIKQRKWGGDFWKIYFYCYKYSLPKPKRVSLLPYSVAYSLDIYLNLFVYLEIFLICVTFFKLFSC